MCDLTQVDPPHGHRPGRRGHSCCALQGQQGGGPGTELCRIRTVVSHADRPASAIGCRSAPAACPGRVAAAEGSMSSAEMRLEAERSLAFAEACERLAETPAAMAAVLQLERQAMAMLTEAGHADWAMSLRPRFRDILVLVAPDAAPLPTRPPGERPLHSTGATTGTAATTWGSGHSADVRVLPARAGRDRQDAAPKRHLQKSFSWG